MLIQALQIAGILLIGAGMGYLTIKFGENTNPEGKIEKPGKMTAIIGTLQLAWAVLRADQIFIVTDKAMGAKVRDEKFLDYAEHQLDKLKPAREEIKSLMDGWDDKPADSWKLTSSNEAKSKSKSDKQ